MFRNDMPVGNIRKNLSFPAPTAHPFVNFFPIRTGGGRLKMGFAKSSLLNVSIRSPYSFICTFFDRKYQRSRLYTASTKNPHFG